MGFRDEREAERARIDALERELAEAKDRAARAEADAAAARAQASASRVDVVREEPARTKKSRAERKREKARRAASSTTSSSGSNSWADTGRRTYFRASYALSIVAYGAVAVAVATAPAEDAMSKTSALAFSVGTVALFVGHLVIGRVTRAPGVFNGSIITLLSTGVSVAGGFAVFLGLEEAPAWLVAGPGALILRIVGAVLVVVLGSYVTASWSSDAARSDATVGD